MYGLAKCRANFRIVVAHAEQLNGIEAHVRIEALIIAQRVDQHVLHFGVIHVAAQRHRLLRLQLQLNLRRIHRTGRRNGDAGYFGAAKVDLFKRLGDNRMGILWSCRRIVRCSVSGVRRGYNGVSAGRPCAGALQKFRAKQSHRKSDHQQHRSAERRARRQNSAGHHRSQSAAYPAHFGLVECIDQTSAARSQQSGVRFDAAPTQHFDQLLFADERSAARRALLQVFADLVGRGRFQLTRCKENQPRIDFFAGR